MTSWTSIAQTIGFITIYTVLATVILGCLFACSVWLKSLVISVQKKFPRYAFATVIAMYWLEGTTGKGYNHWKDDKGRVWKFELLDNYKEGESGLGGGDEQPQSL